ncbi:MAG: Asp-tRNA(Asn)/Glu-tRNA(Gln) amidotransferase subunit GatC [Candidatus Nanoperiomorbaceae bacterium]
MNISEDDVRHLAALSKISLRDDEIAPMQQDLSNILAYVGQLDELDLDNVDPTFQVTNLQNVWRDDTVHPQIPREKLLNLAPEVKNNSVKVPKVL